MCRYNNKISKAAAQAFIGENSESRGMCLTMAGWGTMTTAARLNAVMMALGMGIRWYRKNWEWHYGDRVLENLREVVEV